MVNHKILILKQALKDKEKIMQHPSLMKNVEKLLEVLKNNPFQNPPPYEILVGDMKGLYSRRINQQHRLVYKVDKKEKVIIIISMWSHYEKIK